MTVPKTSRANQFVEAAHTRTKSKLSRGFFWKSAVILFTTAITLLVTANTVADILRSKNPIFLFNLLPNDAAALASKADSALTVRGDKHHAAKIIAMAKRSLVEQAVNPKALRVLGFAEELSGRPKVGAELVLLSEKFSRRDPITQFWLIERRTAMNDVAGALVHYDRALRTSNSSHAVLLPILAGALPDPLIRTELAATVRANPSWLPSFLVFLENDGKNPQFQAAMLLEAGGLPKDDSYRPFESRLVARLADTKQYRALHLYSKALLKSDASAVGTIAFNEATVKNGLQPVTWHFLQQASYGATLEVQGAKKYIARITAASGERGVVARRIIFLKPGQYSFQSIYNVELASRNAGLFWSIDCLKQDGQFGIWNNINTRFTSGGSITADVTIPDVCEAVELQLSVSGGDNPEGFETVLSSISLVRRTADNSSVLNQLRK